MMYKISHSDKLLKTQIKNNKSPLPWPWTVTVSSPPLFFFLLHSYPKTFLLFCFYIAILNHKQVLSLAKKNDSLMILQYSYIFIIAIIIIIIINIPIKVKATNRAETD